MTVKFYNQLEPEIRPATADVYLRVIRLMLGWRLTHAQVRICEAAAQPAGLGARHYPIAFGSARTALYMGVQEQGQTRMPAVTADELGLHHLFSDSSRSSAAVAFNFLEYLRNQRGVSASYEVRNRGAERWGVTDSLLIYDTVDGHGLVQANVCRSLIKLAKFLCHDECVRMMDEGGNVDGRYPYKTELLTELRKMLKDAQTRQKTASHVSDEAKKWIDWPQLLWCVDQLRLQCTTTTATGNARAPKAVAQAYQRYLIVAILSCVPDRQRTIRCVPAGHSAVRTSFRICCASHTLGRCQSIHLQRAPTGQDANP
jgi:hypothetical protein